VKGGNFIAKRGTFVQNNKLVPDNDEHIEGKVEGQIIVFLTLFVKKRVTPALLRKKILIP
jgi:protein PhnA